MKTEVLSEKNALDRERLVQKILQKFPKPCNRVLLIHPLQVTEAKLDIPIARNRRYYTYPPYSLGVLSANLEKRGYVPFVLDLNYEVFNFIFSETHKKITPQDLTNVWSHSLKQTIERFKPDMVGITCTFTMGHEVLIRTADFIKECNSDLPVVAGGVHVTNAPKNVLREGTNIDFVSLYEGDISFCILLDFINEKEDQTALAQIGTFIDDQYVALKERNVPAPEDLNIIPDYGSLPLGRYNRIGEIGTFRYWRPERALGGAVLSNRGCRAKCTFCSVANFNGPGVRSRDVKSVVDEIEVLQERYNIRHITWLDDDLFFNVDRTLSLFNEIVRRNLRITWDASNGVIGSAAVAHEELIPASAESGCIGMYFGVESGNEEILHRIKKPSGVKHFQKLGLMMKKYPQIFTRGFLIIGFPNETLSQLRDTIQLAIEMDLDWYTVQLLTPLPSTPIYNEMVELGLIEQGSLNTDGEGFTMFSVRESERQRRKEEEQRGNAREFHNLFEGRLDVVPTKEELTDLWFLIDYEINYGKILFQEHPVKLEKMKKFLGDVSDRMTLANPLSNLFLAIVESKLGYTEEAKRRERMAQEFLNPSQYWQQRFQNLGLLDSWGQIAVSTNIKGGI